MNKPGAGRRFLYFNVTFIGASSWIATAIAVRQWAFYGLAAVC
jgi:hypothetical protein